MGAYECWCAQKPKLHESLKHGMDAGGIAYALRHALAQVEQNTMAEQENDLLRQQTGVLFGCVKTAVGLLDVSVTSKVWELQSQKAASPKGGNGLLGAALLIQAGAGAYCYAIGQLIPMIALLAALGVAGVALLRKKPKAEPKQQEERIKVSFLPDLERLFAEIDGQMQAIDGYVNDFAYLNEQMDNAPGGGDSKMAEAMANMLEAVYESGPDTCGSVEDAAEAILSGLGLAALRYGRETRHLFTVLPSKNESQTMVPAIVRASDHLLLKRGIAAVRMTESDM